MDFFLKKKLQKYFSFLLNLIKNDIMNVIMSEKFVNKHLVF